MTRPPRPARGVTRPHLTAASRPRRLTLAGLVATAALIGSTPATAAASTPPAAPAQTTNAANPTIPGLQARAAILVDAGSGQPLYGLDPTGEHAIASTTKLMTALVTLEHTHLGQVFTNPGFALAAADSQIGLGTGERMTVKDLLTALLVPSADDAAEDLAYNVGHGSISRFIALMNARARQLGLTHTHYSTPSGLDTPGNYSSAADLARLARYLLAHHPFVRHVVDLPGAVLTSGEAHRRVLNRNDLVGRVAWIDGIKTGHTLDAGYVLVGAGTRNGLSLISVVLGTSSEIERDRSTLAILSYGFTHFHRVAPVRQGESLGGVAVRGHPGLTVPVVATRAFTVDLPRAATATVQVHAPATLAGPLGAGRVVASAAILVSGHVVARIPLALAGTLPAPPPKPVARPFTLIAIALLLMASVGLIALARLRTRVGRARLKRPA